jgi:hypothetical protein
VVALAPPTVRLPISCDQVAPISAVSTALGTTVVKTSPYVASDLEPYAFTEDGALYCYFASSVAGDQSQYILLAMPDITPSRWADDLSTLKLETTPSPFGPNSYLSCDGSAKHLQCNLDMLIGSTWLSIQDFSDTNTAPLTEAQALARFTPVMQTAVTAVQNAKVTEPLWSDPKATPVSGTTDDPAEDQRLATLLGLPFELDVFAPDILATGPEAEAEYPVNFYFRGGGAGNYSISLSVLPQGAWAWKQIAAAASSRTAYKPITGLGDKAVSYSVIDQNDPYQTVIEGTKGDNLYSVVVSTSTAADGPTVLDVATKAASAVLTEIG